MGIETNRIETEFIIKSVCEKKVAVKIHKGRKIVKCSFEDYDLEKTVKVNIDENDKKHFSLDDQVKIYFSYFSHVMTFNATVKRNSAEFLISYPEVLYKNLSRKYERVKPPEGSKIEFTVKGEKFELNFPKTDEYNSVDAPDFDPSAFSVKNIAELVSDFREKMLEHIKIVNIVTFRKKGPQQIEEMIVARTGKVLFIPSTNEKLPEDNFVENVPVLNEEEIDSYIENGSKNLKIRNFEKSSDGVHSELYCPILYNEYVIGYVQLVNRDEMKSIISNEILEYTHQFSKILAFSLKVNNYFKEKTVDYEKFESSIIDISASGLLFCSRSKKLDKSFFIYTDLKAEIFLGGSVINASCRIMRKFKSNGTVFYGIIFLDIADEDFELLFLMLYGRKMTDDDRELWEGGATPPPVEI